MESLKFQDISCRIERKRNGDEYIMTKAEVAQMIDHTLLKPEATKEQIKALCEEAKEYGFHSVCVNSSYVPYCAELLKRQWGSCMYGCRLPSRSNVYQRQSC